MALSFLARNEVSDLCIGKPTLTPLPVSTTVSDALFALRRCFDSYLSICSSSSSSHTATSESKSAGKVSIVDIICFLCSDSNIHSPIAALKSPVSAVSSEYLIPTVDPHSSILEGLDLILDGGARNLIIPRRKKKNGSGGKVSEVDCCCLSQEDFVRFFLDSIGIFSSVAAQSVETLGIINTETLAIGYNDPAISAIHLLKQAALAHSAVVVVTNDGKLIGEISPSTLAFFFSGGSIENDTDVFSLPAAVATLTAGELMAFVDCGGGNSMIPTIKERLKERNLTGMLELLEGDYDEDLISVFSSSSSGTSSSDEESPATRKSSIGRRKYSRSGSYSARMGRKSEEAIVCHRRSSLVAVMIQALAHRVSYVWVVEEEDYKLVGVIVFPDLLNVFREQALGLE
ncbi:CBS domain-containing protein, putative, expressed [Zostera marina]|uniref:CBS domain-containing protein, putative, expressed n=1 Tax=Zostera marina TaxID=29655 RepID=A0A0K9P8R6_ZOSMR|nr:CBS domain-containing protein, putative, expressed [Zostera marina]